MHFVFTRAKLEAKERAEKKRVLEEEEERWIIKINKNLWWHCTSVIRNLIQDGIWWNLSIHNRTKAKIHYNFWKAFKLDIPYLFDYKPISAISRDPKLWTCRLGITRTKNKSKTPGYKPRPIHYYKTELLTTGKPNIFGKKSP